MRSNFDLDLGNLLTHIRLDLYNKYDSELSVEELSNWSMELQNLHSVIHYYIWVHLKDK